MNLFRKKDKTPTGMQVRLALFRGDECLCRGEIQIGKRREVTDIEGSTVLLIVTHEFGLPSCSLGLELYPVEEGEDAPGVELESGLAMGVHTSADWESVDLGADHVLAFLCEEIF